VADRVDPIIASVIRHRLLAIVEEMGEAMLRTSYSQILNSSRDFSTAICGLDGRLIAQAEHVPIHVGALPFAARSVTEFFAGDVHPGDVFLLNDPYHGGNHLPDLTVFVPVFAGERPRFWSINRAHQSDIGGATHGAYNAAATDIWQEGIRITPLRLYDGGELRRDVLEMIATNVRHPRDFRGDLAAMIGSAHVGERRLLALAAEFGWPVADAAIEAVLDGAERQTRAVIAQWQDGIYHGEALLDDDGRGNEDIHIRATVEKRGSDLTIDLSDSHDQVASFVNSSYPNMRSAVVVALSYLIDPDTPKNDGTFRPITVVARPGTVVWANPGMPVTLATNHCGQEILEAIVKALAPACPDRAMAGWGRRFRIAIQGVDPRGAARATSVSDQIEPEEGRPPHPSLSPQWGERVEKGRRGVAEPYPQLGEGGNPDENRSNVPGGKPFIWHFFRRGRAAARRRAATAGRAPVSGRPRAGSSSAVSK
jgi:N-methylhydantoinase B